jgi:co-chaperonin GroES (HSP10)
MEIVPLNKKILIKPVEKKENITSGGIILPEDNKFDLKKAEVISIGDKVELKIQKGDIVLYNDIGADKVGENILIDDNKIIALIR